MPKKKEEIKYEEIPKEESTLKKKKPGSLAKKLKICQREKREYLEGWQRAKADLINFRQRQEKQMADWQKMINEGLILEILPVLDSLDAAIANSKNKDKESFVMIKKQLEEVLKKRGLEKIDCQNARFDPTLHEAAECQEGKENGKIVGEIMCGYKLNGRIIRTAKVKVIKNK